MKPGCILLPWLLALWIALPAAAAQRVVSLAPNATELAYAAGMGETLLAASAFSDYPPEAGRLEQVASWQGINLERVLALKPDLILAWRGGNPQRVLDQLASFGIPIFYADAGNIDEIARSLDSLAQYSPHPQQAHQAADAIRRQIADLKQKYAHNPPRRVLLQFGTQPLFTSSGATLQSQVLSLCGAENIFAESRMPWPQISREQVLARRPQAIVITGGEAQIASVKAFWAPQLQVPVIALNEDWFNRGGPRIVLAAQQLCRQLAEMP
ncbi:vitamin B12 ABC transporter substrate-binding protein BtuF [Serratia ficaria]|uniref:vitamin B12 ABC transporter substrate-binding protein BtuF n=1 Tax=Serratia ficaria TaxID=61651 RepID=UPI00119B0F71|nr:Vitamin B12-binding protein precursor [Serratia ficaria]CAI1758893.1 Vitamin B12-binding protein precursor [Serratia ficaria]CAI1798854.1 Vitamin B12-binding protein precursor [Serratia ficaria]VVA47538.1 Vitamin B12-binding protein precursor [Serratia ficaria]